MTVVLCSHTKCQQTNTHALHATDGGRAEKMMWSRKERKILQYQGTNLCLFLFSVGTKTVDSWKSAGITASTQYEAQLLCPTLVKQCLFVLVFDIYCKSASWKSGHNLNSSGSRCLKQFYLRPNNSHHGQALVDSCGKKHFLLTGRKLEQNIAQWWRASAATD